MQYNFHNEKYKMSDVGGIKREQFREYSQDTEYRNKVDPERTADNIYIEVNPGGMDWFGQIKDAQDRTQETTGRAVRKDAVVLCSTIESVPESWDPDVCKEYFQDKAEWFDNYLYEHGGVDEGSLQTVAVHMDESTPHATYAWIPIKDDKLQAKNILDREFLRDLQKDSQEFTFDWIDEWNETHPEIQIEKMDPYTPDSRQQHLTEAEYREQQIEKKLEQSKELLSELEEKEKSIDSREQIAADREKDIEQREKVLTELTEAPNLESYESLLTENENLKEELSLRDRIIDSLQVELENWKERVDDLKEKVDDWKCRFHDFAQEAGQKIMGYFGYEADEKISEYPSKGFAEAYDSVKEEVSEIDPKSLRTIPDNEREGKFRVAMRTDEGYETLKGGFDTRIEAESWQKDIASGISNICESIDDSLHIKR